MVMRRLLLRHVLAPDEKYVGILLPPSLGGVIANAALSMSGRVTVNLELHGDAGRAQRVHRAGRHSPNSHQPEVHCEPG